MLSAFGELVDRLRRERGISKRDLAKMANVSSGKLTESLRDREWAKENGKRWYGPDLDVVDLWADAFGLNEAEAKHFTDLAHLAHATAYLRQRFDEMAAENERLASALRGVADVVAHHRGDMPKVVAQRLLASIERLED